MKTRALPEGRMHPDNRRVLNGLLPLGSATSMGGCQLDPRFQHGLVELQG